MFDLVFVNPANSLSTTVMVEGLPIKVDMSLPIEVSSFRWDGDNLIFSISDMSATWSATVDYLVSSLEPVDYYELHSENVAWIDLLKKNVEESMLVSVTGYSFELLNTVSFQDLFEKCRQGTTQESKKLTAILGSVQACLM
jgi:hypothetical protein